MDELKWTPRLAYATGLIATDGNLSSDGRHISLTSVDKQQLENFRQCLGTKAKLARNPPGSFSKHRAYRVQFSNKVLYQQLKAVGLSPNKTGSLRELKIPTVLFRDFLRGVIDGDGSIVLYTDRYNVYKGTRYEYLRMYVTVTSASLRFLQWIRNSLRDSLLIRGHLIQQLPRLGATKTVWKLRFAKQASIKLLRWIYYSNRIPCLMRKRTLAERALRTFRSFRDRRQKRWKRHKSCLVPRE